MKRTCLITAVTAAALLLPLRATAQVEGGIADAGADDAGPPEPDLGEPFVPGAGSSTPPEPAYDDAAGESGPEEELPDGKPFAKGDMEPGAGLGFAGYGSQYYMMLGASFAYYVVNGFAPGLQVQYGTDFGSADVPDDVTILPFAKFVMYRSPKFAPYVIALGGREFEFAGYDAVHSWIVGGGLGAHIGFGRHFSLRIEVTFQHHWYDDTRIDRYDDADVVHDASGDDYYCPTGDCPVDDWTEQYVDDGAVFLCEDASAPTSETCAQIIHDSKDFDREWIFPIVTIGAAFLF